MNGTGPVGPVRQPRPPAGQRFQMPRSGLCADGDGAWRSVIGVDRYIGHRQRFTAARLGSLLEGQGIYGRIGHYDRLSIHQSLPG